LYQRFIMKDDLPIATVSTERSIW